MDRPTDRVTLLAQFDRSGAGRATNRYLLRKNTPLADDVVTALGETDTGDPATGWATIGTVDIRLDYPGTFDAHLRHEFSLTADGDPIVASAMRLLVPATGLATGTAIDEIEIYGSPVPEPSTFVLAGMAAVGLAVRRFRRRYR